MLIAFLSIGLVICICLSAFFSASEMSYSSCSQLRMEKLQDEGNKKAKRTIYILDNFNDALGAILIGNNLVNIASSSIGSVLVFELFKSNKYAWASTVLVTTLVIIFGETIPKIIAKKRANNMALNFSLFTKSLMIVLKPLILLTVGLINALTKNIKSEDKIDEDDAIDEALDELSSIIETAEDEEVLDEDQSELVQAAIDFLDISAIEVMTSRVDLVCINIDDDPEDIDKIIERSDFSRIPVYKENIDNIIGILHTNHYYKAKIDNDIPDIDELLIKPCFIYKTTKLTSVLDQLRSVNQHMAIVCDEYGGTIGVVTMEDIMEEIVGEIWDESDEIEEDIKEISDSEYLIDGDLSIADFCELIGIDEEEFEVESDTVGGWALEHFETYPEDGDVFEDEDLKVTVLEIEDRRILSLKIERITIE